MLSRDLLFAMNDIKDNYLEDARKSLGYGQEKQSVKTVRRVSRTLLLAAIIWEGITLYRINHTDDDFRAPALTEESAQTEEETEAAEEADEDTEEDKKY